MDFDSDKIIHLEDEEELVKAISNILSKYTSDGAFKILKIGYYKEHFGNIIIKLRSRDNANIVITRDRWFIEGIIEFNGVPNQFLLEDLVKVLEIKDKLPESYIGILGALDKIMEIVTGNWQRFVQGFDDEHRESTLHKINIIEKERVGEIFRL